MKGSGTTLVSMERGDPYLSSCTKSQEKARERGGKFLQTCYKNTFGSNLSIHKGCE